MVADFDFLRGLIKYFVDEFCHALDFFSEDISCEEAGESEGLQHLLLEVMQRMRIDFINLLDHLLWSRLALKYLG